MLGMCWGRARGCLSPLFQRATVARSGPLGSSRHIESHTHFRFRGQAWCVAEGCQWGQCCAGSHPAWQHDDPGPESPCLLTADPGPSAWPLITMLGRPVRTACWGAPAIAAVDLLPVLDTGLQLLNWASFPSQKWVDAPSAVSPVNMEESVNPTGWGWPSMGPPLGCTPPPPVSRPEVPLSQAETAALGLLPGDTLYPEEASGRLSLSKEWEAVAHSGLGNAESSRVHQGPYGVALRCYDRHI